LALAVPAKIFLGSTPASLNIWIGLLPAKPIQHLEQLPPVIHILVVFNSKCHKTFGEEMQVSLYRNIKDIKNVF
jgi:hypothetical protein